MKLTLNEGSDTGWISWAHDSAKNAKKFISVARVKKDGYFFKKDTVMIREKISGLYFILLNYFKGEVIFREEWTLLRDNLLKMDAKQFMGLANIMLEPYTDFIVDGEPDRA